MQLLSSSMVSMGRLLAVGVLAVGLTACGSNVRLDRDIPVSDRVGVSVDGADARGVTSVDPLGSELGQAPAGLATLVYFDFDDYTVRPEFMTVIEGHARFLSADRQRRVALEGHTDDRGGREYNLALGQKRADAVRRALSVLGVSDTQMESVSFGKEKPASMGGDEYAHSQNRRVELSYR